MSKKCILKNLTNDSVKFYYSMYPECKIKEIILKSYEKFSLNIKSMKYLIGVKINNEIMIPREFFTSSEIKISKTNNKYYWSIKFGSPLKLSNLNDLHVPSELDLYFAKWAANRYEYNTKLKEAFSNEDETLAEKMLELVSNDYASTGYYQIPGEFFASCYLSFQLEEFSLKKIETIAKCHKRSQEYRSLLISMKGYQIPKIAKECILQG
jgi:hypothetical protein